MERGGGHNCPQKPGNKTDLAEGGKGLKEIKT